MPGKHIPQRTCISCRTVRSKREFVRIVRVTESHVEADATGKKSGRGAYLCRARECWEQALSEPRRITQALKMQVSIPEEDLARLREAAAQLPARAQLPTLEEHPAQTSRKARAHDHLIEVSPTTATVDTKK